MAKSARKAIPEQPALFAPEQPLRSWADWLSYYQQKLGGGYFPLSAGKAKHLAAADDVLHNRFNLNNQLYQLPDGFNWRHNPSADLEWLILLHKFYYLKDLACAYDFTGNENYARKWVELIDTWIDQVPESFIDSQVTGRRLQQWLLSYRYFVGKLHAPSVTPDFFARFIQSVNSQTHHLCAHLTPEGNHRTLELYAIFVVAITFPELNSANYFLELSKSHLLANIQEDLLADGVHRELSTDYHHTVLKNYLRFRELAKLNRITLPAECDELLNKALDFSCYVHKPDGFIPAINDGDCQSYLTLLKKGHTLFGAPHWLYAASQGQQGQAPTARSRLFATSGYCILRSDWTCQPYTKGHYLFFDCARLGFGSHGHYDLLNIEAAAFGKALIVDPGRYTYCETGHADGVNWRKYFKGTAAHNTVTVDGLDQIAYQCERPVDPEPEVQLDYYISRSGYDWVQGRALSRRYPVVHERNILFVHAEYWVVTDRLLAEQTHDYDLRFHLARDAQDQVRMDGTENMYRVIAPNLVLAQAADEQIEATLEEGFVSPEYGIKYAAPVVRFSRKQSATCVFQTLLYPFEQNAPDVHITILKVMPQEQTSSATAIRIEIESESGRYEDLVFINHCSIDHTVRFADIECQCRLLFVRKRLDGEIVKLYAEESRFVRIAGTHYPGFDY